MAQNKSNTVQFGLKLNPRSTPTPAGRSQFGTQTTTPNTTRAPGIMLPNQYSTNPILNSVPPKNKTATNIVAPPVSTSTPQFTQGGGSFSQQLDSIKNQALGIQGQINSMGTTPPPAQNTQNASNTQGNQKFFPGVLQSLLGASSPTKEQERTRKEMERVAAGNKAIGDEAKRVSDMYGAEIARVGQLGEGMKAHYLSTGSNVVGSGNAAIASQSASGRIDALSKAQQAALEGTKQQLTGQEQMADALNPSLQASLTQQAQQLSGLNAAGTLAQPAQVPYSEQYLDPYTGQSAGGAGLGGYAGYNAAQQSIALAGQYPDAGVQYDPNLTPEQNLQRIQQAIQNSPSYQKGTFGVPGQQSFAGATTAQTAAQGYNQSFQDLQNLNTLKSYADTRTNDLINVMSQYGIGDNDVRKVNEISNIIGRQFGSEGQAAFQAALTEAQRAYSSLLNVGVITPTEATAASNVLLSGNSTIAQINATINQLKRAGEDRQRALGSQVQTYQGQLQTTQGGGGGNSFAEQW